MVAMRETIAVAWIDYGQEAIKLKGVTVSGCNLAMILRRKLTLRKRKHLVWKKGSDNLSNGTSANDSLTGTDKNDVMSGFGGVDAISLQ